MVLAIIVQSASDGSNLLLSFGYGLVFTRCLQLSQIFAKEIAKIRKEEFTPAQSTKTPSFAFKHGSILLLQQYRVDYQLHHDVYAAAVSLEEDGPFDALQALQRTRALLLAACKTLEIKVEYVQRRQTELMFALDRVLQGDDGTEVLSQKPSELAPNANATKSVAPEMEHSWKTLTVNYDREQKTCDDIIQRKSHSLASRFDELSKIEFSLPDYVVAGLPKPPPADPTNTPIPPSSTPSTGVEQRLFDTMDEAYPPAHCNRCQRPHH